jgi:hypothetical protein
MIRFANIRFNKRFLNSIKSLQPLKKSPTNKADKRTSTFEWELEQQEDGKDCR